MSKEKPQTVYYDDKCSTYWEKWDNFKKHMIEKHGISEDNFVDAPQSDKEGES